MVFAPLASPQQLMAEANAEHRQIRLEKTGDGFDGVVAGLGITGPLLKKIPSGFIAST